MTLAAACAYANGMGTFLHHSAAAFCIVAVATHLCPLSRAVLALSLPLVLQHVVVLLRYRSLALYGLLELLLEAFFESELFAQLPELKQLKSIVQAVLESESEEAELIEHSGDAKKRKEHHSPARKTGKKSKLWREGKKAVLNEGGRKSCIMM